MAGRFGCKPEPGVRIRRPGRLRDYLEQTGQAAGMAEHGLLAEEQDLRQPGTQARKIVAVSTQAEFSPALMRQALGVAGRLGTEVVGLSVCGSVPEGDEGHAAKARALFEARAEKSAAGFAELAAQEGIAFRHVIRFGRPADVVEQECARLKRVEFVLAVKKERGRDGFQVSMPLFEVIG